MKNENSIRIDCTVKLKTLNFDLCLNKPEVKTDQICLIVYKTTNILKTENDEHRFYIGQHAQYDIDPYNFDGYFGSGPLLLNSIKKHGKENFIRETLVVCSSFDDMNLKEIEWIASTSANCLIYPECGGMNQTNGGQVKFLCGNNNPAKQPEIRKKISIKAKNMSDETREKMRIANTGRKHSEETKEKIGKNREYKKGENHHMYGHHHNEEAKKKIGEANKGKECSKETREKISISNKGKKRSDEFKIKMSEINKGKNVSEETREKLRIANFGKIMPEETKEKIKKNTKCGEESVHFGVKKTDEEKKIISEKTKEAMKDENLRKHLSEIRIGKYTGENHPGNKYRFEMSNGEDYWTFFDKKERDKIRGIFYRKKIDIIIYKGITIKRIKKDEFNGTN